MPIYERDWGTNKSIPKKNINDMNLKLIKQISLEEFNFATKSMAKNKFLGLDEVMVDCYIF